MTGARWRSAALACLWAEVAVLLGSVAFVLWQGGSGVQSYFNAADFLLAALVLAWWTRIFARLSAGQATAPDDGTLRALALSFPWLTSLRAALWGLTLLALLTGLAPDANGVALTALMTVWGAAILASNAVNGSLVRLAPEPGDPAGRRRLLDWLNVSAALALGMVVLNVVPIRGFSGDPTLGAQLVYGLGGALDVVATVLALRALLAQFGPLPQPGVKEG